MQLLKNLLLLCFCCLATTGQAQDNPKYDLHRWYVQPGQQQALIDALDKVDAHYRAASDRSWEFYQYEDNTVEVIMPIRDYADLDRIEAQFDFARASLTEDERKSVYDPVAVAEIVTGTEQQIIELQPELSYTPAGEEALASEMQALQLSRYTHDYATTPDIREHGKKLVEMMRKANSPAHMHFYTLDYGSGQYFEVVYLGKDRADLDRRLAEQKERMAGPEGDAWRERAMEIARRESVTYGTKVTTLGQEEKPATDRMYGVAVDYLKPGKEAAYVSAAEKFNGYLREGKADLYWTTSIQEDGRVMHFAPVRQMSDMDKIGEQFRKRAYQLKPAQQQEIGMAMDGLTSSSEVAVMRHHVPLSYLQEEIDADRNTMMYKVQTLDYDPADRQEVMAFLENTKAMLSKAGATTPYEVWSYNMGGPDNRIIVVDYGADKASIDASIAADYKSLGTELDGWVTEMKRLLKEVEVTYGRKSERASYWPDTTQ